MQPSTPLNPPCRGEDGRVKIRARTRGFIRVLYKKVWYWMMQPNTPLNPPCRGEDGLAKMRVGLEDLSGYFSIQDDAGSCCPAPPSIPPVGGRMVV